MMRFLGQSFLYIGWTAVGIAYAAPPAPYINPPLGHELFLKMGSSGSQDFVSTGGGRFDGSISATGYPANSAQFNSGLVNLWCVDYQMSWSYDGTYRTNVLGFNEINNDNKNYPGPQSSTPNNPKWGQDTYRDVRYEDVKNYSATSGDRFRVALPANYNNDSYEALFRYKMAAYLVTRYSDMYNPSNSTYNQAIQIAIWNAMDTKTDTDSAPAMSSATNCTSLSCQAYQLYKAAAQYVDANWNNTAGKAIWNRFAIVSAWTTKNGVPEYVLNSGDKVQTFLVEITPVPEPGYLGALGIGITALVSLSIRRRRRRQTATP